jgi:glyoxylase-like metal-dependent hydrolase (beta-lactamase superfamily II)
MLATFIIAGSAQASVPMAEKQAPGYHRISLGDFEVTALSDGVIELPAEKLLLNTSKKHVREVLTKQYLEAPVTTSVNTYLINTGEKLVLVDTGTGGRMGPTTGKLIENLKASGYQPGDVDEIYITHMHGDHVGGLMSDGKMAFPNAVVRAGKADAEHWLSEDNLKAAPEDQKRYYKAPRMAIKPYQEAGQFKTFAGEQELVPGVTAVPANGHTPGHSFYRIESGDKTLMLWGDVIHVAPVQFPEPKIAIQFDSDSDKAVKVRLKEFEQASKRGYLAGSAHLSFPGFGRLRKADQGYEFLPMPYGSSQ